MAASRPMTASIEKSPATDWKLSPLRYKRGVFRTVLLTGKCDDATVTSLMLWALPEPPPASEGAVALWQQFLPDGAPQGLYSLPQEVHHDRDRLRTAYLAWLHEVGQRPRRGRTLRDRMQIRPGLSYWWMTIPADFSLEPDSPAYRAVRLMAFAHLADRLEARTISVATRDRSLARAVAEWARATDRQITVIRPPSAENAPGERGAKGLRQSLYRALPPLAAARVLTSAIRSPKHGHRQRFQVTPGGITFVDYLAHLGPKARLNGEFDSNYWGPLVHLLDDVGEPITWLHISGDFATPTVVEDDERLVAAFNDNPGPHVHHLLHSHLTWGVLARSSLDYLRIASFGLRVVHRRGSLDDTVTGLSLWPVFRAAYRDQFFGRTAMLNAVWINLMNAAVDALPHQRLGVYLFENQPWEMAFQHAWRRAGHGELIGVAHTTALFWSTRLFKDPHDMWSDVDEAPMPWPDAVAVNGPAMRSACERAGYPSNRMLDVEALRFLPMSGTHAPESRGASTRVLVLGEYSPSLTDHVAGMVLRAVEIDPRGLEIAMRPHPAAGASEVGSRVPRDEHHTLAEALHWADVAVCGVHSSAVVEASSSGRPTAVIADPAAFTSSPGEGLPNVHVVSTPERLSTLLHAVPMATTTPAASSDADRLFDAGLPRWARSLARGSALRTD